MSGLLAETDKLVKATVAGQLATRGDAAKFAGGWGKLVGGVNNLCDAFVGPINVTAEYVDRISKGDIPPKITDTYNGDFNEIKNNLNACIDTMSGLLAETDKLVKATVAGQLATRGDAAKFAGGWGSWSAASTTCATPSSDRSTSRPSTSTGSARATSRRRSPTPTTATSTRSRTTSMPASTR